jgi:fatty acid desaturase
MIVRDLPSWLVWAMNLAVLAALAALAYFMQWMGPAFVYGWLGGFAFCYIAFRCWRFDYDEPTGPSEQSRQPPPPRSRDPALR